METLCIVMAIDVCWDSIPISNVCPCPLLQHSCQPQSSFSIMGHTVGDFEPYHTQTINILPQEHLHQLKTSLQHKIKTRILITRSCIAWGLNEVFDVNLSLLFSFEVGWWLECSRFQRYSWWQFIILDDGS